MCAMVRSSSVALFCCALAWAQEPAATGVVYIIRHGEKTNKFGCLTANGFVRSLNLIDVFGAASDFQIPKALFAGRYGDKINCERTNQTMKPLARKLKLRVETTYGGGNPGVGHGGGNKAAAAAMKAALATTGGPVLAAWEHHNIKPLVRRLGVAYKSIPSWPEKDFDTIFAVEFHEGNVASFRVAKQLFSSDAHALLPYAGTWKKTTSAICWPGKFRDICSVKTVKECKRECDFDPECGGFSWPDKHMKWNDCERNAQQDIKVNDLTRMNYKKMYYKAHSHDPVPTEADSSDPAFAEMDVVVQVPSLSDSQQLGLAARGRTFAGAVAMLM